MNNVKLKGVGNGIDVVICPTASFDEIQTELRQKFSGRGFTKDKTLNISVKGKNLTDTQRAFVEHLIHKSLGKESVISFDGAAKDETSVYRGIVRSGQIVASRGNLVILGDVNPGGYIKAIGSIFVLGTLRGIAHAGINNSEDALICALSMEPSQLRIADVFACRPDGFMKASPYPEIAALQNGEIIIEKL